MNDPTKEPRLEPARNPMRFDGKRHVFGGSAPVVIPEGEG